MIRFHLKGSVETPNPQETPSLLSRTRIGRITEAGSMRLDPRASLIAGSVSCGAEIRPLTPQNVVISPRYRAIIPTSGGDYRLVDRVLLRITPTSLLGPRDTIYEHE